jgi:hypothetical protein
LVPGLDRYSLTLYTVPVPDEPRWTAQELRAALDTYEDELRAAGRTRNTIHTYIQHPERFINWLERRSRRIATDPNAAADATVSAANGDRTDRWDSSTRSSRYEPLRVYLAERSDPIIRLSFKEIEQIIGVPLPASARRHRPWWANQESGTHVHARSWLDASRRTANVDMINGIVNFVTER